MILFVHPIQSILLPLPVYTFYTRPHPHTVLSCARLFDSNTMCSFNPSQSSASKHNWTTTFRTRPVDRVSVPYANDKKYYYFNTQRPNSAPSLTGSVRYDGQHFTHDDLYAYVLHLTECIFIEVTNHPCLLLQGKEILECLLYFATLETVGGVWVCQ